MNSYLAAFIFFGIMAPTMREMLSWGKRRKTQRTRLNTVKAVLVGWVKLADAPTGGFFLILVAAAAGYVLVRWVIW